MMFFSHITQSGCRVGHSYICIAEYYCQVLWQLDCHGNKTAGPTGNRAKHYFILSENKWYMSDRSCLIGIHVRMITTGHYF